MSEPIKQPTGIQLFGEVAWLYAQSPRHRDWPIESLMQWVMPALQTKQFRLLRDGAVPKAWVAWAWMSEDAEERYLANPQGLMPPDWQSGERGWIVDFIAPDGAAGALARVLRNDVFANDVGRAIRFYKDRPDEARILYVHGAKAVSKARDGTSNPTVRVDA